VRIATNDDVKITIKSAGNVGIGSTTPGSKLDITGGVARVLNGTSSPAIDYANAPGDMYVQHNLEVDGTVYASLFLGTLELNFTQGSILFEGAAGLTQDNAHFFWIRPTAAWGSAPRPDGKIGARQVRKRSAFDGFLAGGQHGDYLVVTSAGYVG